ncbi:MAG: hypothetical protein R3D58_06925 [Saprospiraceae bacterium]|nr:hypothetical protein [Lewinellaceae bacterium]
MPLIPILPPNFLQRRCFPVPEFQIDAGKLPAVVVAQRGVVAHGSVKTAASLRPFPFQLRHIGDPGFETPEHQTRREHFGFAIAPLKGETDGRERVKVASNLNILFAAPWYQICYNKKSGCANTQPPKPPSRIIPGTPA